MLYLFLYIVLYVQLVHCEPWWHERNIALQNEPNVLQQDLIALYALNCSSTQPVFAFHNPWTHVGIRSYKLASSLLIVIDADISIVELTQQKCNVTFNDYSNTFCVGSEAYNSFLSVNSIISSPTFLRSLKLYHSIIISGHGFGGTVAQLILRDLQFQCNNKQFYLVTFGAPPAGNRHFSELICNPEVSTTCFHHINEFDYFPSLQAPIFEYEQSFHSTQSTHSTDFVSLEEATEMINIHHSMYLGVKVCGNLDA